MLDIIIKYWAEVAFGLLLSGFVALYTRYCCIANGVQGLLRADIIRSYEKYTERGYCPIYAREAMEREYKAYHGLHGNDVATKLYEKMLELPTEIKKGE